MAKKLFISYSHKDENLMKELGEHLSSLERNDKISVWYDRKIPLGQDWKNKIDENIESADIILFLISPSFIASDYCNDVECKLAIKKHEEGSAIVVPIVIKECDWHDSKFAKFQAAPEDGKAIASCSNRNKAWLNVIKQLKKIISPDKSNNLSTKIDGNNCVPKPVDSFMKWLNDTEIEWSHSKVDKVFLKDIYVDFDLKLDDRSSKDFDKTVSSEYLSQTPNHYLVYSEEQQGKTTLLKHLFIDFLKNDYLPIYVDSKQLKNSNLQKALQKLVKGQYLSLSPDEYLTSEKRVLLIDDFEKSNLNHKFRNLFIQSVIGHFDWTVITCQSSFHYVATDIPALGKFKEYKLLGFGNFQREAIIKKWVSLGVEESIEESQLYVDVDDLKAQLNTVIKKNIVPSKPIYILMLIQMFEAYKQNDIELTSYGHCYQQLIYQSFEKARINGKDYAKYLNVLTEFAWSRFKQNSGLNKSQIESFFAEYDKTYLSVNKKEVIDKLLSHSILLEKDNLIDFKYPYIYYFFVGKKIAESFAESDEVRQDVEKLLKALHREDFANIIIFITHHTKDSWVLNKISEILSSLFSDQKKASLAKDQLLFMDDFIKKIPNLVMEKREVPHEREKQNRRLDENERTNEVDNTEPVDILAKINTTFKGMEIAGQIIRNRHATMTRPSLYDLASCATSSGLRFLSYFIQIADKLKSEIVKLIESQSARHPNLSNSEIQQYAEKIYHHLTYCVIKAVILKISSSIGSKEADEIYALLKKEQSSPAYILIKLAIDLQFNKSLSINDTVQEVWDELKDNPVCLQILKEIVIQHVYTFPVSYQIKQQLSALLNISVQAQRMLDQKKSGEA